MVKKTAPAMGIEKAYPASAFRRNFCPPTGSGLRAATVAIWPRRPQIRFRHAAAYCKQAPSS
jgi:hypothetical protein